MFHPSFRCLTACLLTSWLASCGGKSALNDARPDRDDGRIEIEGGVGASEGREEEEEEEEENDSSEGSKDDPDDTPGNDDPAPSGGSDQPPDTPPEQGFGGGPNNGGGAGGGVVIPPPQPTVQPTVPPGDTTTVLPPTNPAPRPTTEPSMGCEGADGCACETSAECEGTLQCISGVCIVTPTPAQPPDEEPPTNVDPPPVVMPPVPPPPAPTTPGAGGSPPSTPPTAPPPDEAPPEIDGELPDTCTVSDEYLDDYYCSLALECEDRNVWADCEISGDWAYCWCDNNSSWVSAQMPSPGANGEQCIYMAELCTEVEPTQPLVCEQWQEASSNFCYEEQQCSQQIDLGSGGTAESYESESVWCDRNGETWRCSCNTATTSAQFQWAPASEGASICQDARSVCDDFASLEPAGPISCAQSYQSAGSGYCNAEQECTQAANLDGTEILLSGYVWTNCEDMGDGTYACSCGSGSENLEFDIQSGATAWDTCTQAVGVCTETVDVSIGNAGGGFGPGIPVPVPVGR